MVDTARAPLREDCGKLLSSPVEGARMKYQYFVALLLIAVLSAGMFAAGFAAQKYKPAAYRIRTIFRRTNPDEVREFLERQYSRDAVGVPLDKTLDTALLPVAISGVRISDPLSRSQDSRRYRCCQR